MPEGAEPRSCVELAPSTGPQGHSEPVPAAHDPASPRWPRCAPGLGWPRWPGPYPDGPLHLGPLVAQPQHPDDGQSHTQPVEEAEEVDDGEDVTGEGVKQGHDALQAERQGSVSPCRAWAGARNGAAWATEATPALGYVCGGRTAVALKEDLVGATRVLRKQRPHWEREGNKSPHPTPTAALL